MNRICIGEKRREPFSWTTLRGKHCRHPIAVMGVVDTFGPWTWHTKKQVLAILFLLMFQNKSHDKYDASEKISVNCVLEKYILQKWHTRRQRRGVLFFQPQYCLYVILKLKDSKVIKFVLLTPKKPNFLYSTFCSKSGLWKLESPVYHF